MDDQQSVVNKLADIHRQLERINAHPFLKSWASTPRMLMLMFLKGAAFGLGSVLGASLFLSMIMYFLSYVEFVPILGEWVSEIIQEVQKARH